MLSRQTMQQTTLMNSHTVSNRAIDTRTDLSLKYSASLGFAKSNLVQVPWDSDA